MGLYEQIKEVAKNNGYSINRLEKELGFPRSSMSKFNEHVPSMEKVRQIADFLDVPITDLSGDTPPITQLTSKDEKDIQKQLEKFREQLISQEGLMFDGDPASPEAIESILSAMEIGMAMAKKKNKEKFTPKKYRKKD